MQECIYIKNQFVKKRKPISRNDLLKIQNVFVRINEDIRWLVAIISDTEMRLSEAAGLKLSDLVINSNIPHVIIQPNSSRRLKTVTSKRKVPLSVLNYYHYLDLCRS